MSMVMTGDRVPGKTIYDTSVYIHAIRNRDYYEQVLPQFIRLLPTTYFCAVVVQELKAGCLTRAAFERVEVLLRPFRRTGRLVTPTFADWDEAGDLLSRLLKERPDLRDKLPQLINDTLIALCSVRLGAVIYTANEDDFALVQRYKHFYFESL